MRQIFAIISVIPLLGDVPAQADGPLEDTYIEDTYIEGGPFVNMPPPTEARGCFYIRGREYCGRYCYWELNGKRYCQERLRHAYPQADPDDVYVAQPRSNPYRQREAIPPMPSDSFK